MNLSNLTEKRRKHFQSCSDNKDNSHKIIVGLYSDPSHFIYELLQNADDAGASEVIFNLTYKYLEIKHNGKRLFDFNDVDSITTVGSSRKKDDINAIGTFGAGFKSVFAITKEPEIHSGDYNFKIIDFIVPETVEPLNIKKEDTVILLPFNHSDISSEETYKQISERLQMLEFESLLFLRNLKNIQWSNELDKGYYLSEIKEDKATLTSMINEQDNLTNYLIFKKIIKIDDTELNIVIAYLLNSGSIVPADNSKLFVFFPTNERTGLKFLVHAPYKTTPSRETIPFDDNQNKIITNQLSILIAESVQLIKDKNLLDVNFLTLLPIDSKNKHHLYNSAFQKVKDTLTNNRLLPAANGKYINAKNSLLAREKELTTLLNTSDCSVLFDRKNWLNTEITDYKTKELKDYFKEILHIPEITLEQFCTKITSEFIKTKNDKWIIKFYAHITKNKALYRAGNNYQKRGILRERPIIRLEDDSHICPENHSGDLQVYLPHKEKSKFKTVKRTIVNSEEAIEFLNSLGLTEPDNIAEIKEFVIPKYKGSNIEKTEYIEDLKGILAIWLQSSDYRKKEISDLLKQSQIIRCINPSKSIFYQKPDDVYFCTERLLAWYDGNPNKNIYFLKLDIELTEDIREFLKSLGVRYDIKIYNNTDYTTGRTGWYERGVNGFNPYYEIDGLHFSLSNISIERSIFLWSILLRHNNRLKGCIETKSNQNHSYKEGKEKISVAMVVILNAGSWLYDKNNQLILSPINQIVLDDLSDEYLKKDFNIDKLIKVIGFKLDEIIELEEKTGKKVILFSSDEYKEFEEYKLLKKLKEDNNNTEKELNMDDNWTPETFPDDATIIDDKSNFKEHTQEDLSGQTTKESTENYNDDNTSTKEESKIESNPKKSHNSKAIGDWGESIANRYLVEKYPENEVVWLNKNGTVGKGYDFVIRKNENDIIYYEVKSKTDESPQLFQISGTQWNWATSLHNSNKGDMYIILLISNAGKKEPKIREIINPVALWKGGRLCADPINIQL